MVKALKVSVVVLLLCAAPSGCGNRSADPQAVHADCFPVTDVRSFRGSTEVDAAGLSTADTDWGLMAKADARSFVARASASELTAAGIDNLGQVPAGRDLLLFVNHGAWNQDQVFVHLGGLDAYTDPSPEFVYPTITWVVNVVDSRTHRRLEQVTSPRADRSVCFRG